MPRVGTGFTNLSTLLNLNRPDIERMAGQVGGTVDSEQQRAQAGLDSAYNQWAGQATHGGTGWQDWLAQHGGGGVEQGLQSAQMAQNYQGSNAGREALVQKTYRGGGNTLDAALLGGGGGARFANRAAVAPVAGQNPALAKKNEQAGAHTARLSQVHDQAMRDADAASAAEREREAGERRAEAPERRRDQVQRRSNPYSP